MSLSDSGNYYCDVMNRSGVTVRSDTIKCVVHPIPTAEIITPSQDSVMICSGDTLKLEARSVADADFTWRGPGLTSTSGTQVKAFPTEDSRYVLSVSANGCSAVDSLKVRMVHPMVEVPYVLNVSEGATTAITATDASGTAISPATGLTWTTNESTVSGSNVNPFSFTVVAGLEKVYVKYGQEGCTVYDTVQIRMKGGGSFLGGVNDGFTRSSVNFGVKLVNFPTELCAGVDTALNAEVVCVDNPDDYQVEWFKLNPARSMGTTARIAFSPVTLSDSGSYYCKVTNKAGVAVYSDTMHMTVNEVPVATIIDPSAREKWICWGDTLQVMGRSSVADATLTWRGTSIVGPVNSALTKVAPVAETDYIFRADNRGCWTEDTLTVKINHPFVDIPSVKYATEGSSLQLTAVDAAGTALPATGLSWNIKPSTFVGMNMNPFTLSSVDHDMVVEVTLMAEGCSATDSTRVLVKGAGAFHGGLQDGFTSTCLPPVILVQPDAGTNQCVSAAKSLELHVVAEGSGIKYQWEKWDDREGRFKPFVPSHSGVTGEHSPLLKFETIREPDNGAYRCVLSAQCGEDVVTDTCTVSVKGEPIILSGINVERDVCAGSGDFEFNVIARNSAGRGNLQFRWYKNSLSNQISREADTLNNYYEFKIETPTGDEEGLYIVEVTNDCGSVYDSAYLPVIVPPHIEAQSSNEKVCYGGNVELYVKTNRDERYRYALYELTNYPDLTTKKKIEESYMNKFILNRVTQGGYYQIKVFHPFCDSTFSSPIVVNLEYPITIDGVSSDTALCAGGSLTLRADASTLGTEPLWYQWFKDGMPLAGATHSNTWNLSNLTYERDTVHYHCEVSNSCGTVRSKNIAVAVKRAPVIASGPELLPEYCEGDTLRAQVMLLSNPSEVDSVRWFYKGKRLTDVAGHISGSTTLTLEIDSLRPGDGDGYYYLEVYNSCGKTSSSQVKFTLFEQARFVKGLDGVRLLMCDGDKQMLMVQATGSQPIRYIWTQSGNIVADGYSNRLEVDASKVNKTETFICHIQNMCSKGGELTEAYITASRPESFDFIGGGSYCEHDEIGVEACLQGSDTSVLYHLYRKPGVEIKSIHGRDVQPMTGPLCFKNIVGAGTYYVVAEDTNGCTAVMPGEVEVKENPLPKDFALQIRKQLCENTDSARVELIGTELGIVYDLCKKNGSGWDTLRVDPWPWVGTGAPLFFDVTEGEYKVVAKNEETGCVRDLSTALTIIERPVPQECDLSFWKDDSVYCRNAAGDVRLDLDLACFETGCSYSLQKDGTDLGRVVSAAPVYWAGLDEGVYSVKAVNNWGCETVFGHKVVTPQDPPVRYSLVGQTVYCKNDTDSNWLELEGSEPGVIYSFRYLPGTVYKNVVGTGGDLFVRVPLVERKYYVIASDTTPEHCEIAMYDTVELRQSRLDVSVTSPVYVNYGDTTVLNITVTGAEEDVSYEWTPADKLKPGHNVKEDPTTVAMTSTTLFTVTVTDASGCPETKKVWVIVRGGDFGGEIVDGNGPVDTVQLCAGDMLELYAAVGGGACNGNYIYSWSDEHGTLTGGVQLTPMSPASDTKIYLHVDCGNESVDDSVVVLVNPVAPVDTIKDAGTRCIAAGEPVEVRLNGSVTLAKYYLQSSADRITWTDVDSLAGTGGALQFTLPDAAAYFTNKYLRIVARMPHRMADGGYCETEMAGELEILQAPADFGLSGGWAYCADAPVDSMIVMDGSEQNVTYRLMQLNGSVKFTQTGTGRAMKFEPVRDSGKYVVQAVFGRCITVMPDTVEVLENPMPGLDSFVGAGEYCTSECPIEAGIRGGEANVEYTFSSSNPAFSSLSWTGPGNHTFVNDLCDTGRYTIMAENVLTGCKKEYGEIVLKKAPGKVTVNGGGEYCADSSGLASGVCVASPEDGVVYGLYKVTTSGRTWEDSLRLKDGHACSFKKLAAGKYVVVAKLGDCEHTMPDTVEVLENPMPGLDSFVGAGEYCTSECPVVAGILGGEANVKYTFSSSNPAFTSVPSWTGPGDHTFVDDLCDTGRYTIMAENVLTGCKKEYGEIVLLEAPKEVEVNGGGEYCADSSGLASGVCVASPQSGINYELYKVTTSGRTWVDSLRLKDGQACSFKKLAAGKYVVVAKAADCERTMQDTLEVLENPMPGLDSFVGAGEYCTSECPIEAGILGGEANVKYTFSSSNPAFTSVPSWTGPGDHTFVDELRDTGRYTIMAENVLTGCKKEYGEILLKEAPEEVAVSGGGIYCADSTGLSSGVCVASPQSGIKYKLYKVTASGRIWVDSLRLKDGQACSFKKLDEGKYVVVAKIGDCERTMQDTVNVVRHELPGIGTLIGNGSHCVDDMTEVSIGITKGEADVDYTLVCDAPGFTPVVRWGTDTLIFGTFSTLGTYRVEARNTVTGCEAVYDSVVLVRAPQDVEVSGGGEFCPDSSYLTTSVCIASPETGITYGLYAVGNTNRKLGRFVAQPDGSLCNSLSLMQGDYVVIGKVGNCERTMTDTVKVETKTVRDTTGNRLKLKIEGNGCVDSTVVLYVEGAPASYGYQLYHEDTIVGSVQTGTGGRLEWNISPAKPGKWSIKSVVDGCEVELDASVEIEAAPDVPELKGDTLYCAGDDVKLWVEGAVQDVDYGLYRLPEDTLVMEGALNALRSEFLKVTAGTYYVRAKRGNCEISGSTLKVDSVKTPVLPTIETNDCVEAGKGEMTLSGLMAGYDYKISGPVNMTLRTLASDTSLTDLLVGVYSVQVVDAKNGCESEIVKDTIREGVPNDTLIPPFAYCDGENGVKLQLSGVHMGVTYKILTESGSVLATLTYPQATPQPFFAGEYGEGKYIFRVERSSFPAGCYRETLFEVVKSGNPSSHIAVTLEGTAPVCDGNDYRVRLEHTAAGGLYVLMLQGNPVDTMVGTGGSAVFADAINKAGDYMIRAIDSLGACSAMLDTVLTVHPLPEIWADDCDYCETEDSGCIIAVKRMEANVLYRLNQLDTLMGPGSGSFEKQPAGVYEVIAENQETGCRSKDTVTITAKPGPHEYAVLPGCYTPDDVFDLQTNGSDTGVDYFLYCDGTAVSSVAKAGTGSALHFGDQDVTGVYRVKAVAANGCVADMRDSVIVYHPLPEFDAEVSGSFCNGDTTGVLLSLKQTAKGWKYYVTNGYLISDTLHRIDGGVLAWNKLYNGTNAVSILNGIYYFRAISPCGTDEEIGSLTVTGDTLPQNFPVVDKPQYYCAPEKFTIALAGSERGMKYIVERYFSYGGLAQTYPAVIGDGTTVPFVLGEFDQPGYYKVIADNGCPRQLDFWEVKGGQLPNLCPLTGDDMCWQSDADTLRIELSCRDNGVNYYLYRDVQPAAELVDSLTSTWRPAPEKSFTGQNELGCYYVVGVNASTGCRREMPGRLCLNASPAIYEVEPDQLLGDTLVLCRGVDSCIWLSGSENSVGYELLRDGVSVNKVTGTGNRLNMGHITESGVYRVNAYVCGVMMKDSVIVKILELPSLSLEPELRYCQGTSDSLKVLAVTSDRLQYNCYRPDGTLLSQCNGKADGSSFYFPASVDGEGYYVVEVVDENGCKYADSTQVVMEHYPNAYNITSSDGEYICRGGYVKLGLDGSENNVRYQLRLYSPMEEVSEQEGTGSAIVFPKQINKPGTYYVTATYRTGLGCSVDFGSYTLQLADTILPFEVESVVNSYCMTSSTPQGSLRLDGSQAGMEYYLTRDGEFVQGSVQTGNGGSLLWTGLEGKVCDDYALTDGYIYRVVARDPVSGCERSMYGSDTIVAASPIRIIAREPNNVEIEKCEGSDMKFSVTAMGCRMTYKWMRDGLTLKEGSDPYYNIDSVQISDYGVYECEITNSCGSVMTPKVTLLVRELVRLVNPMPDEYVCDDTRKTVMFSSGFRNAETYAWYKLPDDATVIGTRNYYELTNFQVSDSGTYVVVANNRCDAEVRDTVRLLIGSTPTISVSVAVDTLCAGSYYATPFVTSTSPFEWYLNGVKLGHSGSRYTVNAVSAADEGIYSVEVENACGKTVVPVSSLFVDDTLRIVNISDSSMIRCPSDGAIELSIDVSPISDRTKFLWQDRDLNPLGTGNKLSVGPFSKNSYHTYRVWFLNKCSSGSHNFRDINILVPDDIEVADPLRNVTLCADCTTDTVLRLGITKTMMIEYEWYYRQTEEEGSGVLVSTADTVSIPTCTQNTGYYYCHYFNRCESKTTETSWVRIDTVPVVRSGLQDQTLCEGMSLRVELSATGGGLTYEWHMIFKDGRDSIFDQNLQALPSSTDYGMWAAVTRELDSAQIWCRVFNSCGEDSSDTMLLRVNEQLDVKFTEDTVSYCEGVEGVVYLELVNGVLPWSYRYRTPSGVEKEVLYCQTLRDTLRLEENGLYQLIYVSDTLNCIRTEGLPSVYAIQHEKASLAFSGGGEFCYGDTVSLSLSIEGGTGPWEVTITDGQDEATSIVSVYPLRIYGRDTTLTFLAENSAHYHINRSVYDVGSGCWGNPTDSVVKVVVHTPDRVNFISGPWHVGQCRSVNLYDYLQPSINGVPVTKGCFYVGGEQMGTDHLWLRSALRGDSCYQVSYGYTDEFGCKVTSDEISVCVDSLPYGVVVSSDVACESIASNFELQLFPAGNIDSVLIHQIRYKKWAPGIAPKVIRRMLYRRDISASGLLQIPLNWDQLDSPDSCMVFKVLNIWDVHGCTMADGNDLGDTIWRRWDPEVAIETKCLSERDWKIGRDEVNLTEGDSVAVRITLVKGQPLWNIPALGIYGITGKDTVIWLKEEGTYDFRPQDGECHRQPLVWPTLKITYLDTGYFRGRLWLEGPYDSDHGIMRTGDCSLQVRDSLHLPSVLPLKPQNTEVIDWVEVELRIGNPIDSVALMTDPSFLLCRDSCLLLSNGQLADRWTGDTVVGIRNAFGGGTNYRYVVMKHRNHLSIMSKNAIRFVKRTNRASAVYIDFTQSTSVYCRDGVLSNHMTFNTGAGWMMCAGEVNRNELVSLYDPNRLILEDEDDSPLRDYELLYDIDLDGCVKWPGWANPGDHEDWKLIKQNRQKFTEIE